MSHNVTHIVEAARQLTLAERREVLARLFSEQSAHDGSTVWMSVRFSEGARVVAYAPEQESYDNKREFGISELRKQEPEAVAAL